MTLRSIKWVFAVALSVAMSGCATLTGAASQTPIVSLFIDAAEGLRLQDSMTGDDVMSEEQVRAMMVRPLPPGPGISFDVALLRRTAAAASLGDMDVLEQTLLEAQSKASGAMLELITEATVMSHAFSGNIERAKQLALTLEQRYIDLSRRRGESGDAWVVRNTALYTTILGIAAGTGDQALFGRLMTQYPPSLAGRGDATESAKYLYELSRQAMLAKKLTEEGDYEGAARASEHAAKIVDARLGATRSEADSRRMLDSLIGIRVELSVIASLARKPLLAFQHIEAAKKMTAQEGLARVTRSKILFAEAIHRHSIGDHRVALALFDESWSLKNRFMRAGKVTREYYLRDRARIQLAMGAYREVLNTLGAAGTADTMSISHYRSSVVALRAYAKAALGELDEGLSDLDRLDAEMLQRIATDGARLHFAVKTFAHHLAFAATGSERNLREAIAGGRHFATAYRRMRLSGQHADVITPVDVFRRAKDAYLLSVILGAPRFGVTPQEIVNAFSLVYDSEMDEDIAAAALRTRVAGLPASEVRRLQDLRLAARTAFKRLEVPSLSENGARLKVALEDADRATRELEEGLAQARHRAPILESLLLPPQPALRMIQQSLLPSEALVAFAPTDHGTAALCVSKSGAWYRVLPLTASDSNRLVDRVLRSVSLDSEARPSPFATLAAADLYKELFAWAKPQLLNANQLVVASRRSLARIPFGLLLTKAASGENYRDMAWLVKTHAITHAPSIGSWISTVGGANGASREGSFIAWADPDFSGMEAAKAVMRGNSLDRVPTTLMEAKAVAKALNADPTADVIHGAMATRQSVLSLSKSGGLAGRRVVMFATHGVEAGKGGLQPALAMASEASGIPGMLTLGDVVGLRMDADWVLLSACNTSAAEGIDGESLSGLARGFFYAGTRRLLVTYWKVESESAAELTARTVIQFGQEVGITHAQSLQRAAVAMIEGKSMPPVWSHPAFWAAYALVGSGRR